MPEKTCWPGWGYVLIEEIDARLAPLPGVPPANLSALSAWVTLGASLAGPLVTQNRAIAAAFFNAAKYVSPHLGEAFVRSFLLERAEYLSMPLDLRIGVMRSRGKQSVLKFGWRKPRKGDLSQIEATIYLGTQLLIDSGVPTREGPQALSAFQLIGRVMDLFLPALNGRPRDSASIVRARNRARGRWTHRELEGRTRELLLNFRKDPPGELGVFVRLERWKQWTPEGGITYSGVEPVRKERSSGQRAAASSTSPPTGPPSPA